MAPKTIHLLNRYNEVQQIIIKAIGISKNYSTNELRLLMIVLSFFQGALKYSTELETFIFNADEVKQLL